MFRAAGSRRPLPQGVEAAVYFCTLEALNNVAKYAEADAVRIRLGEQDDVLTFEIVDPGMTGHGCAPFDPWRPPQQLVDAPACVRAQSARLATTGPGSEALQERGAVFHGT